MFRLTILSSEEEINTGRQAKEGRKGKSEKKKERKK